MIIAIDPGKSGGIAVLFDSGKLISEKMPETEMDIVETFESYLDFTMNANETIVVYMERVSGFTGSAQPGSRMFNFGKGYGFLMGVIMSKRYKLELVMPQKWMKALSMGTKGDMKPTQWKNKLKAKAQMLYPSEKVTLKTADALLILEYARKDLGR